MNTLQKIREIMGLPKTNLYAEVKIDDGRVLVTEADAFEPGVDVMRTLPWISSVAGGFIMLLVLGFNLLGDGLRDALDPRMRRQLR